GAQFLGEYGTGAQRFRFGGGCRAVAEPLVDEVERQEADGDQAGGEEDRFAVAGEEAFLARLAVGCRHRRSLGCLRRGGGFLAALARFGGSRRRFCFRLARPAVLEAGDG